MALTDPKIENVPLSLLYNFTNVASAVLDVQALMTHFFNILKTEVDFDLGAYIVDYESHTEGRLYTRPGMDTSRAGDFSGRFLNLAPGYCKGLTQETLPSLDVSILAEKKAGGIAGGATEEGVLRTIEVPLLCWGEPSGVIALGSYKGTDPFEDRALIETMVAHVVRVLERLLAHIFAGEKKLSDILYSMTEGVFFVGKDGAFTAINPKGRELLSEFCRHCADPGKLVLPDNGPAADAVHACEFSRFLARVKDLGEGVRTKAHTEEITNEKGQTLSLSISALTTGNDGKYGHVLTAKDITEERMLQKKLLLSNKLASLGEMAAGIAHEINNPLQSVMLNIDMLKTNVDKAGLKKVRRLEDGVVRIKRIVKDLLIFAREETTENENVDLNIVIEQGAGILRHQLMISNVQVMLELDSRPLIVKCNRNLFQQVIVNLLQNAKDAIEGSKTGSTVSIRSRLLHGKEVVIEVSDDGPGIPENIIDKIFDPFLTTKELGKGTGLGLSVSRKIITSMEGCITVASSPGEGTTFSISIPYRGRVMDERRKSRTRKPDYSILVDKTVLVVDDELEVLGAVKEAISPHVSRVATMSDSTRALGEIRSSDFDLILLDIKMPGMNGMELYRGIEEHKPYLVGRVIVISGDIESEGTAEFLRHSRCRHLSKPFGVNDLLATMCETVSQSGTKTKVKQ